MIPRLTTLLGVVGTLIVASAASGDPAQGKGRPKAALRVNPALIFVPQRVVASATAAGGWDLPSGTSCDVAMN